MTGCFRPVPGLTRTALLLVLAGGVFVRAQEPLSAVPVLYLPDNPEPTAIAIWAAGEQSGGGQAAQPESTRQDQARQDQVAPSNTPQDDRATARQQLRQQESQRMFGIVPMFNTSYVSDAVSLTAGEKIKLAFRSSIDPVSFAGPAVVAGVGELNSPDNNNGFGWGAEGYFKKWGAAYLDAFNGRMIGKGVLPAVLRQDPRYFRLGRGSGARRTLYAISMVVVCRHDNARRLEPNYSNVGGNFAAGALSNLYYPSRPDRDAWQQTVSSGLIVTAEGAAGAIFQEFWPDMSRKLFHKDPTHGLDDKARAAHTAEQANQRDQPNKPLAPAPK